MGGFMFVTEHVLQVVYVTTDVQSLHIYAYTHIHIYAYTILHVYGLYGVYTQAAMFQSTKSQRRTEATHHESTPLEIQHEATQHQATQHEAIQHEATQYKHDEDGPVIVLEEELAQLQQRAHMHHDNSTHALQEEGGVGGVGVDWRARARALQQQRKVDM